MPDFNNCSVSIIFSAIFLLLRNRQWRRSISYLARPSVFNHFGYFTFTPKSIMTDDVISLSGLQNHGEHIQLVVYSKFLNQFVVDQIWLLIPDNLFHRAVPFIFIFVHLRLSELVIVSFLSVVHLFDVFDELGHDSFGDHGFDVVSLVAWVQGHQVLSDSVHRLFFPV